MALVTQTQEGLRKQHLARSFRERPALQAALKVIRHTPELYGPLQAMMARKREMMEGTIGRGDTSRDYAALLAGIACNPRARALFELAIDRAVTQDSDALKQLLKTGDYIPEIVIGGGLHAAIYAGAKIAADGQQPLIIERRARPGGIFSLAQRPVFYLNSRNRRESKFEQRRPGTQGPLNSEVGGVLQPSDISYREYQPQTDLAFITRLNLALYGRMICSMEVIDIRRGVSGTNYLVTLLDKVTGNVATVVSDRIIVATGLGEPKSGVTQREPDERIMTFEQFLERMGDPTNLFPLKGFKRVAVVGANDSGRATVEYLLGQGPDPGMSVASLDTVENIAWIGQSAFNKEEFEKCERSRYQGIGRYMPRFTGRDYYYRVEPYEGRALSTTASDRGITLRWEDPIGSTQARVFDYVILATGYEDRISEMLSPLWFPPSAAFREPGDSYIRPFLEADLEVSIGGRAVATKLRDNEIYKVGPAANLKVTEDEIRDTPVLAEIPENSVALFRYSDRTASFARLIAESDGDQRAELFDRRRDALFCVRDTTASAVRDEAKGSIADGLDALKSLTYEWASPLDFSGYGNIQISVTQKGETFTFFGPAGGAGGSLAVALMQEPVVQALIKSYMERPTDMISIIIPFSRGKLILQEIQIQRRSTINAYRRRNPKRDNQPGVGGE